MFSSRDSLRADRAQEPVDVSLSQHVVLRADFECIMSFVSGLFRVWVSMFLFFCLHWNRRKYRQTVNWGVKSVRLNNTSGRTSHTKHRHKRGTEAGIEPSPLWSEDATLYLPQPSLQVHFEYSPLDGRRRQRIASCCSLSPDQISLRLCGEQRAAEDFTVHLHRFGRTCSYTNLYKFLIFLDKGQIKAYRKLAEVAKVLTFFTSVVQLKSRSTDSTSLLKSK